MCPKPDCYFLPRGKLPTGHTGLGTHTGSLTDIPRTLTGTSNSLWLKNPKWVYFSVNGHTYFLKYLSDTVKNNQKSSPLIIPISLSSWEERSKQTSQNRSWRITVELAVEMTLCMRRFLAVSTLTYRTHAAPLPTWAEMLPDWLMCDYLSQLNYLWNANRYNKCYFCLTTGLSFILSAWHIRKCINMISSTYCKSFIMLMGRYLWCLLPPHTHSDTHTKLISLYGLHWENSNFNRNVLTHFPPDPTTSPSLHSRVPNLNLCMNLPWPNSYQGQHFIPTVSKWFAVELPPTRSLSLSMPPLLEHCSQDINTLKYIYTLLYNTAALCTVSEK